MFLLDNPKSLGGQGSVYKGVFESAKAARDALNRATGVNTAMSDAIKGLLEIQDEAIKKQRSISQGLVVDSDSFRVSLQDVYKNVENLGVNFSEVAAAAGEISSALGKTVVPSGKLLEDQIAFSKVTGISVKDLTITEASFMRIYSSQEESFRKIQEITNEAQKVGLNVKQILDDVSKNLNNMQKFKMDDTGLTSMATEAAGLRSSIEGIGAMKLAETLWDPKKAVELSQKMQMLGGDIGKLGNSFELMRMGAYDADQLQESMLKVYEQAFKIDEMGNVIAPGQAELMQLKGYAEAMGSNLDTAMQLGRERAKQASIEERISSSIKSGTINKDQVELIKSLGEIKDGKVTLNIPGIGEIKDVTKMTSLQAQNLKEYQDKAALSDKDMAIKNMSISENQLQSLRDIEEYLVRGVISKTPEEQKNFFSTLKTNMEASTNTFKTLQTEAGVGNFYSQLLGTVDIKNLVGESRTNQEKRENDMNNLTVSGTSSDYLSTDQPFTGSKLITGDKGTIQTMIFDKDDDFLAAPKLNEILNKSKMSFDAVYALNEMSSKPLPKEMNPIGETFTKTEATINTNNTTEIKFDPLVIRIEGVDGNLKQMLEKGDNATLLTDKIREEFSKMPKFMRSKGVFGG
jgi:hypothetical protein